MTKVKVCPICGNEFTGRAKYCSHDCKLKARRLRYATKAEKAKVVKVCPICGTEFKGTSKDKSCSNECASKAIKSSEIDRRNRRWSEAYRQISHMHEVNPDGQYVIGSSYEVTEVYGSDECERDINSVMSKWDKYAKMEEEIKSSNHH